ncbi:glycosyltransferase family 2 protein [Cellvibrio sp. ARAG 10.3]|uniref:glycosyltransferase family 2 protein n=1 Tax=Cellvibrio sp. ARAG 10.3 TaxID=3451358 RepID=UPI003F482731
MRKIIAVIVTYHPDAAQLLRLIERAAGQADQVLVIDNATPGFTSSAFALPNVQVQVNHQNLGLAAAYNQGVEFGRTQGASHILLFDQDSCPSPTMVKELVDAWEQTEQRGLRVAAAGPNYTDAKGRYQSPFVKIQGLKLVRVPCGQGETVEVDHLISSGCLISMEAIDDVGAFEDQLFIDYVDTEWCLRARQHGYALLGVGAADMEHDLGESYLTVFNRRVPSHSPLRHYYLIRNGCWLISRPWVGWRWRVIDSVRLFKILVVFSLFSVNRYQHCRMMVVGLFHAVRKKMGKLPT